MRGHVRGVQNKSKTPRERKDFLVNVFFLANLNCFSSLSHDISLRPLPRHVTRCLLFRLNRLIDELSMCFSARSQFLACNVSAITSNWLRALKPSRYVRRVVLGSPHRNKFETNLGVENMYHSFAATHGSAVL